VKRISPTDSFWTFAIRLYEQPGLSELLLRWQDTLGADVNMVLFACWHGATRGNFSGNLLARSEDFSRQWSGSVTKPLRSARIWMKANPVDTSDEDLLAQFSLLRTAIKQIELQSEQFQENWLESLVAAAAQPIEAAAQHSCIRHNLRAYADTAGLGFSAMQADLDRLADATVALVAGDQPDQTAP